MKNPRENSPNLSDELSLGWSFEQRSSQNEEQLFFLLIHRPFLLIVQHLPTSTPLGRHVLQRQNLRTGQAARLLDNLDRHIQREQGSCHINHSLTISFKTPLSTSFLTPLFQLLLSEFSISSHMTFTPSASALK